MINRKHWIVVVAALMLPALVSANVAVTVDPGLAWLGYMNVQDLPVGSGPFLWGSPWGTADLPAVFSGDELTLSPNTNTYNPDDPYWVNPDGSGNKWMNANMYVEPGVIGDTIDFTGLCIENTFVDGYTTDAFIKVLDPSQGWITILEVYEPMVDGQAFALSLEVPNTAGLVSQYGFQTDGANANPAGVEALGHVVVIPEPGTLCLLALGGLALIRRR
jgi:hypothetical protein